jgi:hypothetical protein
MTDLTIESKLELMEVELQFWANELTELYEDLSKLEKEGRELSLKLEAWIKDRNDSK